jgi:hypothetical protein
MSILDHPEWAQIRLYLRVERYDRDTNAHGDARHRIEVNAPEDPGTRAWLLAITMPCTRSSCAFTHHPVRVRGTWTTWYYSASCGAVTCRNNKATAIEYRAIRADLEGHPPPGATAPLPLFE